MCFVLLDRHVGLILILFGGSGGGFLSLLRGVVVFLSFFLVLCTLIYVCVCVSQGECISSIRPVS